jgi:fibronectin-binding autotransporter adhesin
MEGFVGLGCNARAVSQERLRVLRGSVSHTVLALAATAVLSGSAWAVDAGQTVQISTAGSKVTINGGTVQIDGTGTALSYGTDFTLNEVAGNTIDLKGTTATLTGRLTGKGAITFSNSGANTAVLTLAGGAIDYTGATTIANGTTVALSEDATLVNSSSVTVDGTFDVSDGNNGAVVTSLSGASTGIINTEGLSLTVSNAVAGATFAGVIKGSGYFVLSAGTETLTNINTYTGSTTVASGTLTLSGAGSIAQSASVLVYGTLDASAANSAVFKSLSGSGTLKLGANDLVLTAASGSFAGIISGTGKLIFNGGTQWLGGTVSFTQVDVNAGTFEAGSDTVAYNVANKADFAFYNTNALAMTGVISGVGTVEKYGAGVATVSTIQTYTGATTVSGGTLKLTGAGSIAASKGVQVDAVFDVTEASNAAITSLTGMGTVRLGSQSLTITGGNGNFSGSITGTGGAIVITDGSQSLSGANTYTGTTTVTGGKLVLVSGASLKSTVVLNGGGLDLTSSVTTTGSATINSLSGTGAVNLAGNTLILATAGDTYGGKMSGSGSLMISAGTETLSGANDYTGTTTVSSTATLKLIGGSLAAASKLSINGIFDASGAADSSLTFVSLAGSGQVKMDAHGLVLNSAANTSTIFSGVISGTAGLSVTGTGTQVLSGDNAYAGGTTIGTGATLQLGSGSNTGAIQGNVSNNGTLRFYRLDTKTFAGQITGTGAVVQAGIGTTVLTADNTYTGGTTISAGTLQIGDYNTTTHTGGLSGSILGDVVDNGTLAFARADAVTITATVSGAGNLAIRSGAITLTGASDYTGQTRIDSGAELDLAGTGSIAESDKVFANGTFDISNTTAGSSIQSLTGNGQVKLGTQTLTLTGATDTFAGVISGTGGLILAGGNETLSGTSTYTGATTVQAGILSVTGSIASSAVTVKSGATVSGTGTIGGLTVENGGTVKAGMNGSGTLNAAGNVVFASGSTFTVDMTSATASKLAITGSATLNGKLAITSADGTYQLGQSLTILTANNISGTFATTDVDLFTAANGARFTSKLSYTNTAVMLEVDLAKLSTALGNGATTNELAAAGGIDKAIAAHTGAIPATFLALGNLPSSSLIAGADELSGEIGADMPLAAKALFTPFLNAMSERTAMLRPIGKGQTRPLETWVTAYGGTDIVDGDDGTGSHKFHSSVRGGIAGVQWSPWSNFVLGGALSLGSSDFHIADDLGKGHATAIEAGVYGYMQTSRHFYNSFAAAVSGTQIKTTRVISVAGTDTLTGKVTAYTFGGRYEAGVQLAWFSPYIGVQDNVTMLPGYGEGAATGHDAFALNYDSRTVNSGRAEVGLRHYIDIEVTPRWILTPDFTVHLNDRLAYAYDLSDGSQSGVTFSQLAASDFNVYGAKPGRHGVLATVGADVLFNNGLRLTTHLDTAFSQKSQAFTGFVGVGYTW